MLFRIIVLVNDSFLVIPSANETRECKRFLPVRWVRSTGNMDKVNWDYRHVWCCEHREYGHVWCCGHHS